jgi:ribose/xylose/arabinose/galactoside ABC-type transport system permease subunit
MSAASMATRVRRRAGTARALLALGLAIALSGALDGGSGSFFTEATIASVLQYLATLGLIAVGLGAVMAAGELDLSVGAMAAFGGAIAVKTGGDSWLLGLVAAVGVGGVVGLLQGTAVVWLRLSSVAVTLGGLLALQGATQVLTKGSTLPYANLDIVLKINDPIATVLNWRVIVVAAVIVVVGLLQAWTRFGRDLYATGSDPRAARTAGVATGPVVLGVFVCSGATAALSGALLSYSLAAAAPGGLADVLVPAIAATILGGVSLQGGSGNAIAIGVGVLALGVLTSGLTAAGQASQTQSIYIGAVLLTVALLDSRDLRARWLELGPVKARRVRAAAHD